MHTDYKSCYTTVGREYPEGSEWTFWMKTDQEFGSNFVSGDVVLLPRMQPAMLDGKEVGIVKRGDFTGLHFYEFAPSGLEQWTVQVQSADGKDPLDSQIHGPRKHAFILWKWWKIRGGCSVCRTPANLPDNLNPTTTYTTPPTSGLTMSTPPSLNTSPAVLTNVTFPTGLRRPTNDRKRANHTTWEGTMWRPPMSLNYRICKAHTLRSSKLPQHLPASSTTSTRKRRRQRRWE